MKGIILSGGSGTRLFPLTKVTSKQLLPVYDKPMIYYPLQTLLSGGITDIMIIVAPEHAGDYLNYLGSGKDFGANVKFTYEVQDKPEGLAQAFLIAETFLDDQPVTMILGDNIFEDDFSQTIRNFKKGGHVFAKQVHDPERFGVIKFDANMKAQQIMEKPKEFISDYAQTGLYIFDPRVVEIAKNLKPSARGELEIVDVANWYLQKGELNVRVVKGDWIDAGTIEALYRAGTLIYNKKHADKK